MTDLQENLLREISGRVSSVSLRNSGDEHQNTKTFA